MLGCSHPLRSRSLLVAAVVALVCLAASGRGWGADAAVGPAAADPVAAKPVAVASPSPPSATPPPPGEYQVGAGDILRVEVFDEKDMTGDFTVDADGRIVFPLLGQVEVAGMPVVRIKDRLTELLERDYLYHPQVDVTVKEYRSQKVQILGNVGRPGTYYLDGPTRLFDLLSRAEQTSPRLGDVRRGQMARIIRRGAETADPEGNENSAERIFVDLYELLVLGKEEANVWLADGDVIYIPEQGSVHVIGEVKRPGSFPYEEGMSVLKAISLAGGASKKGSLKGTVIKRIVDGKEVRIKVRMEDRLAPDDIVEVPLSFW